MAIEEIRGKRRKRRRKRGAGISGGIMLLLILGLNLCIFGQVQIVAGRVHWLTKAYNTYEEIFGVSNMFGIANYGLDGVYGKYERIQGGLVLKVPEISQADIPTGCESVSTVSVLQYLEIEITPEEFINKYLPCEAFYRSREVLYGPDPHKVFAGNPFTKESLGCFPPVIIRALENMIHDGYEGMGQIVFDNVSGVDLEMMEETYLAKGIPVILWITSGMRASYPGMQYHLPDGSLYIWQANEHCMVLCGYDKENYYFMDPQTEGQIVSYTKELVVSRYEEMGCGAVVIYR